MHQQSEEGGGRCGTGEGLAEELVPSQQQVCMHAQLALRPGADSRMSATPISRVVETSMV